MGRRDLIWRSRGSLLALAGAACLCWGIAWPGASRLADERVTWAYDAGRLNWGLVRLRGDLEHVPIEAHGGRVWRARGKPRSTQTATEAEALLGGAWLGGTVGVDRGSSPIEGRTVGATVGWFLAPGGRAVPRGAGGVDAAGQAMPMEVREGDSAQVPCRGQAPYDSLEGMAWWGSARRMALYVREAEWPPPGEVLPGCGSPCDASCGVPGGCGGAGQVVIPPTAGPGPWRAGTGMMAGMALLWASGLLLLRRCVPPGLPGAASAVVALAAGAVWCAAWGWAWLGAGLPGGVSPWARWCLAALSLSSAWWAGGRRQMVCQPKLNRPSSRPFWLCLGLALLGYFIFAGWLVLGLDTGNVPTLGHYGYRAKVWFHEGWPADYPGGEGWALHVPGYPPGPSLIWHHLYAWMGGPESLVVRMAGALWLAGAAVLAALWLHGRGFWSLPSVALPFALLFGHGLLYPLASGHQEPLLIFIAACGAWAAGAARAARTTAQGSTGWALAAASLIAALALVKVEGLFLGVLLGISLGLCGLRAGYWGAAGAALAGGLWGTYVLVGGAAGDFSAAELRGLDLEALRERASAIWKRNGWYTVRGGVEAGVGAWPAWWPAWLGGGALLWGRRWRQGAVPLAGAAAVVLAPVLYALAFSSCYLASTLPLGWHMNGVWRMQWCVMVWAVAVVVAGAGRVGRVHHQGEARSLSV
jgi:hypothetical protein